MPLSVGDSAPDFELTWKIGQDPLRRSDHQGDDPLVVLFFPLAFSPVCTEEMCAVAEDLSAFNELGAKVVGISVDSPFVNAKFAEECGAEFPILSDFNAEAADAFGVRNDDFFGMKGVADRSAFVVDAAGDIVLAWHSGDPGVMPPFEEIKAAVAGAGPGGRAA
jgi:peroxiredoxin